MAGGWRLPAALFFFTLIAHAVAVHASPGELTVLVTRVVDGDTFYARIVEVSSSAPSCLKGSVRAGSLVKVRLADINAPERGELGYAAAGAALSRIIGGKTVLLDVDDVYCRDRYGRLVAVVYVRHNSSHLVNVNKLLVDRGVARIWDHDNEFNPYKWRTYVKAAGDNGAGRDKTLSAAMIAAVLALAVLAAARRGWRTG
ncbi:MAG: nuclease [Hyperthermus sp.]|nr:MAG: nuclease [Hyperthermus sp.]